MDKERGPLSETSLDQKRIAERRLVCEWNRVYVDICWLLSCLLCAVATPRVVSCMSRSVGRCESKAGRQQQQHQAHGAAADGATLSRAEQQGRCWRQRV